MRNCACASSSFAPRERRFAGIHGRQAERFVRLAAEWLLRMFLAERQHLLRTLPLRVDVAMRRARRANFQSISPCSLGSSTRSLVASASCRVAWRARNCRAVPARAQVRSSRARVGSAWSRPSRSSRAARTRRPAHACRALAHRRIREGHVGCELRLRSCAQSQLRFNRAAVRRRCSLAVRCRHGSRRSAAHLEQRIAGLHRRAPHRAPASRWQTQSATTRQALARATAAWPRSREVAGVCTFSSSAGSSRNTAIRLDQREVFERMARHRRGIGRNIAVRSRAREEQRQAEQTRARYSKARSGNLRHADVRCCDRVAQRERCTAAQGYVLLKGEASILVRKGKATARGLSFKLKEPRSGAD